MAEAQAPSSDDFADRVSAFADRVLTDAAAAFSAVLVVVGDKAGLYRALTGAGPLTAEELAGRAGLAERYVREWLNNQAAGGYVTYDPATGCYELPAAHAAVLADEQHPAFMQGAFQFVPVFAKAASRLEEAFRTGEGVAWSDYDPEVNRALERFLKPTYAENLVATWIPALDGADERLRAGCRVADIGCGSGVSTVLMAREYPRSHFLGIDTDESSLGRARELAEGAGVAGNTSFDVVSGTEFPGGEYGLITAFNCFHDMGDPTAVAIQVRDSLAEDGAWLLVEPRAGDRVEDNLTPFGRMTYGGSTMLCIPSTLAQGSGFALGAQAGEGRLREILSGAGLTRIQKVHETRFSIVLDVRR